MKSGILGWLTAFVVSAIAGAIAVEIGLARLAPGFIRDAGAAFGDEMTRYAFGYTSDKSDRPPLAFIDVDQGARDQLDYESADPYDMLVLRRDMVAAILDRVLADSPSPDAVVFVDVDVGLPSSPDPIRAAERDAELNSTLRRWNDNKDAPLLIFNRARDCAIPLLDDPRVDNLRGVKVRPLASTPYDDQVWPTGISNRIAWTCPLGAQDPDGVWRQAFRFGCWERDDEILPAPSAAMFAEAQGVAPVRLASVRAKLDELPACDKQTPSEVALRIVSPRYQWSDRNSYEHLSVVELFSPASVGVLKDWSGFVVVGQTHANAGDQLAVALEPASPGALFRANQMASAAAGSQYPSRLWIHGLVVAAAALSTIIFLWSHTLRTGRAASLTGWRKIVVRTALHPAMIQLLLLTAFAALGGLLVIALQGSVDWPTLAISLYVLTLGLSIADLIIEVRT